MIALALLIAAHHGESAGKLPKWYDQSLAGYVFWEDEKRGNVAVMDPKSGYYLVRTSECDGADITMYLTRDRSVVRNEDFTPVGEPDEQGRNRAALKSLPNLRTGFGISIGDSPERVIARLGKPSHRSHDGNYYVLKYSGSIHLRSRREETKHCDEQYTFRDGKLVEVCFDSSLDSE